MQRKTIGVLVALGLSCVGVPPSSEPPPEEDSSVAAVEQARPAVVHAVGDCPTSKISFTQQQGCLNDGSVEFCLPKDDPGALARVLAIDSSVRPTCCGGRAGCDLVTEQLYVFPTPDDPAVCTGRHGALTDAAWLRLCQIAAQPEVARIVPTWYE